MAQNQSIPSRPSAFRVVGVGASAGGISALRNFFRALQTPAGLAFIVIQHLHPDQKSHLVEILAKTTPLPVLDAADGVLVEPDRIYVAPPGQAVTLTDGRLRNTPLAENSRRRIDVIDIFFESLATECKERAVAVVLSGTGTDGSAGAVRVKQCGGVVFAQDFVTSDYDRMPKAVVAAGVADHILPAPAIAQELVGKGSPPAIRLAETSFANEAIASILDLIRKHAGLDLEGYKATPLVWRVQQRMILRSLTDFRDYAAVLSHDPAELEGLTRDVPIHVTSFFRDPHAWQSLEKDVVAPLLIERGDSAPIRAWTAACSTGEEAYSLAMLLSEHSGPEVTSREFQLFATDASAEIVARASSGLFAAKAVEGIAPERKARFFDAVVGGYQVKRPLRQMIVFAPQHLLIDPPLTNMDLITCRNLLIYLEPQAAKRVITLLHGSLRPGGYLFLGNGEPQHDARFEVISRQWRIYRKADVASPVTQDFPLTRPGGFAPSKPSQGAVAERAHRALMAKFDLPSVLINTDFRILQVFGDTSGLFRLPRGEPTHNLLQLVPTSWAPELRDAANQAIADRQTITVSGLPDYSKGDFSLSVKVTPAQSGGLAPPNRLLVSFMRETPDKEAEAKEAKGDMSRTEAVTHLWAAQDRDSDALRVSNEELEASREELQALNEELRAVNDQLNAVNEQLQAVNEELRGKVDELETQQNVLASGGVIALFLDQNLRIRWFTPEVRELFPFMERDIGRLVTDFSASVNDPEFLPALRAVLKGGQQVESEVVSRDGRWFSRSIRPYRAGQTRAPGVAVTFADITVQKRAESVLRLSEERQTFLLKFSDALRPLTSAEGIRLTAARMLGQHLGANRVAYAEDCGDGEFFDVTRNYVDGVPEAVGRYRYADYGPDILSELQAGLIRVQSDIGGDARLSEAEKQRLADAGVGASLNVPLVKNGRLVAFLGVNYSTAHEFQPPEIELVADVAERIWAAVERAHAEAALAKSEEKYRTLFSSIDQGFTLLQAILDPAGKVVDYRYVECNPAVQVMNGLGDVTGKTVREVAPEFESYWLEPADRVLRTGEPLRIENYNEDNGRWYRAHFSRVGDVGSRLVGLLFDDITERKRAEAVLRESEQRKAVLLELSDRLRSAADPRAAMSAATELFARCCGLAVANYALVEPDGDSYHIGASYNDGRLPSSLERSGRISDHGPGWGPQFRRGEAVFSDDHENRIPADAEASRTFGVRSGSAVPLIRDGRLVAIFSTGNPEPRRWTEAERWLQHEVAERTWTAVERAQAEAALRESETRFRTLAEAIDSVFYVTDLERGELTYLSPSYERIWGRPAAGIEADLGVFIETIHPEDRESLRAGKARQARGEPVETEYRILMPSGATRWILDRSFPVAGAERRLSAGSATDITERKRTEALLRENAERHAFLLKLSDALRPLSGPLEIQAEATRMLGEQLAALQVQYWEAESGDEHFVSRGGYANGMAPLSGRLRGDDLGFHAKDVLRAGRTLAVADAAADPLTAETELAAYSALGIRAHIGVPLVKQGRLVAVLCIYRADAHDWSEGEIALSEEVAGRIRDAVERARAEAALRDGEARLPASAEAAADML